MRSTDFRLRLDAASFYATRFALTMVRDQLPFEFRYAILMNASHDAHLHIDIYGNREIVEPLRNRGKFFDHEDKRERDLILIDCDDPARNVCEVTEEWAFHNGHCGTREDVVFDAPRRSHPSGTSLRSCPTRSARFSSTASRCW